MKIGVRLIAGLIARRIVPFVAVNDAMQRGERMSLIQLVRAWICICPSRPRSRCSSGDRVVGGQSVLAPFE